MSIEKRLRRYITICDICGEELPPQETFIEAVRARREAKWKSVKADDGTWDDICPVCQGGGIENSKA